jgi:threonine aldolase
MYDKADSALALGTNEALCDLRSDTVTQPDAPMRQAIAEAQVGDDVYGDDPTVNELEAYAADLLGKEAAVFFPSGTQSNLSAVLAHCQRGEEVILGSGYHVYNNEAAGASVLGGVALYPIAEEPDGALSPEAIAAAVKPEDSHCPVSRLVSLENTFNGAAIALPRMEAAAAAGRQLGLSVHLDGARFFNAVTALDLSAEVFAATADTVSICLSKGLGAPAGSLLVGGTDLLKRARRWRKMLGGGMRQAGILAAAGLYALHHNVARLADDHQRAEALAKTLVDLTGDNGARVHRATNMVFFTPGQQDHGPLRQHMLDKGILIGAQYPTIRMVLHKDIDDSKLARVQTAFESYYAGKTEGG